MIDRPDRALPDRAQGHGDVPQGRPRALYAHQWGSRMASGQAVGDVEVAPKEEGTQPCTAPEPKFGKPMPAIMLAIIVSYRWSPSLIDGTPAADTCRAVRWLAGGSRSVDGCARVAV